MRLLGEAKGTCAARQRKFRKQPPRVHHAMQNSLPASFVGGRCLRRMLRVPPGRNVISLKSALWALGAGPGSMYAGGIRNQQFVEFEMFPVSSLASWQRNLARPLRLHCTLGQIDGDAVEIFVCTHLHRPQNSRKVCYVNYLVARQVIFYRSVTKGAIFWRVTAVDHSASTYGCGVDTRTGVPTR